MILTSTWETVLKCNRLQKTINNIIRNKTEIDHYQLVWLLTISDIQVQKKLYSSWTKKSSNFRTKTFYFVSCTDWNFFLIIFESYFVPFFREWQQEEKKKMTSRGYRSFWRDDMEGADRVGGASRCAHRSWLPQHLWVQMEERQRSGILPERQSYKRASAFGFWHASARSDKQPDNKRGSRRLPDSKSVKFTKGFPRKMSNKEYRSIRFSEVDEFSRTGSQLQSPSGSAVACLRIGFGIARDRKSVV